MKRKKLYITDWLLLKPYNSQKKTDQYYLKLSNEVFEITKDPKYIYFKNFIGPEGVKKLCCFLVSYFEDIISETKLWTNFVKKHRELYQKPIPFYEASTYFDNEINTVDVAFLSWYFLNTMQKKTFIPAQAGIYMGFAEEVMVIFEKEFEFAPENDYLQTFYRLNIEVEGDEFYAARQLFGKILLDSYLFFPDTKVDYFEALADITEEVDDQIELVHYMKEQDADFMNQTRTRLLAMRAKDWAAELMGKEHPHYNAVSTISDRITGFFLYKGQDENSVFIEHIASRKKFEITKNSYDQGGTLTKIDMLVFIGIVRWNNEWWFSGVTAQEPYNEDRVKTELNNIYSLQQLSFLELDSPKLNTTLKKQERTFLEISKGRKIIFLDGKDVQRFIGDYNKRYKMSNNISQKNTKYAKDSQTPYSVFENKNHPAFEKNALIYFNPKSGLEIIFGLNDAFPMKNNPFYDAKKHDEALQALLRQENSSIELANYCLEQHKDPKNPFDEERDNAMLKDLDFLLRFWKPEHYHTMPQMSALELEPN